VIYPSTFILNGGCQLFAHSPVNITSLLSSVARRSPSRYGITNNLIELPEQVAPLQANGKPVKVCCVVAYACIVTSTRCILLAVGVGTAVFLDEHVLSKHLICCGLAGGGGGYADGYVSFVAFKVELNSGDKLYSEIRDMNFSRVGLLLSSRARSLSKEYDERHGAKTVSEIKQFTSKLKRLQDEQLSLRMHTDIAADILTTAKDPFFLSCLNVEQTFLSGEDTDKSNNHIEECICKKEPLLKVR
jgi:hypothetical protein